MKRFPHILFIGSLFFILLAQCGGSDSLELRPPGQKSGGRPEIHAIGFPDLVPENIPYFACDFPLPCLTNQGEFRITGLSNIALTSDWGNENQRLYLRTGHLIPGSYRITIENFRAESGEVFDPLELKFNVIPSGQEPDTSPPRVESQSPADQDFSVSPRLKRIVIRFDEPIDSETLEASLSDGSSEIRIEIETKPRFSDLLICTILEKLKPETCYIYSLYGVEDFAGNILPVHFLLFATDSDEGGTGAAEAGLVEHLVLSEICVGGYQEGGASDEFIELYNPSLTRLDLAAEGYRIYKASATGKPELVCDFANPNHFAKLPSKPEIPAQGYFLIANQGALSGLSDQADALVLKSRMTLAANNSIWLTKNGVPAANNTIDLVGMGMANQHEGPLAALQPPNGMSIERKARADSDENSMKPGGRDANRGNALDRDQNADDFILRSQPEPQSSRSDYEDWSR